MNPNITICGDTVVKTGEPKIMRIEVEKATRAHEIGERCGIFQVPRVLDYDQSSGQIKFEFIPDLKNLRDTITAEKASKPLMRTIGASLAAIHKHLLLPNDMVLPLPDKYCLQGTEVFLHGDFGLANIYVTPYSDRVVILDWQATRKLDVRATYGARYFDLMCFIYNLFYRPIGRTRYKMTVPATPLAQEFLYGYFKASDFAYDRSQLRNYMKQFLNARLADRKSGGHWKRRLLLIPSHIKLRKFINSFDFNRGKSAELGQNQ